MRNCVAPQTNFLKSSMNNAWRLLMVSSNRMALSQGWVRLTVFPCKSHNLSGHASSIANRDDRMISLMCSRIVLVNEGLRSITQTVDIEMTHTHTHTLPVTDSKLFLKNRKKKKNSNEEGLGVSSEVAQYKCKARKRSRCSLWNPPRFQRLYVQVFFFLKFRTKLIAS